MRTIQTDCGPVHVRSLSLEQLLDHGDRLADLFRNLDQDTGRSWFDIVGKELLPVIESCCDVEGTALREMELGDASAVIEAWIDEMLSPKALSLAGNLMRRMGIEAGLMSRIAGSATAGTGLADDPGTPSPTSSPADGQRQKPGLWRCLTSFLPWTRRSDAAAG